ncbi:hypothetical protein LINPERPRIM_LOCUS35389, partial [Linum perenne]
LDTSSPISSCVLKLSLPTPGVLPPSPRTQPLRLDETVKKARRDDSDEQALELR